MYVSSYIKNIIVYNKTYVSRYIKNMKEKLKIIIYVLIIICVGFVIYNTYKSGDNKGNNIKEGFLFIPNLVFNVPVSDAKELPVEIQYQVPLPANQLDDAELRDLDTDILRNVRVLANFSKTDELDFYQMYTVLKLLRNKEYNFIFNDADVTPKSYLISSQTIKELNTGDINKANLELFTRIKLELISAFNKTIIENNLFTKYHKYEFFKIIGSNLISHTHNKTVSGDVEKYVFTLKISREAKYTQFTLYYDIDIFVSPSGNLNTGNTGNTGNSYKININKLELLGLPIPNDIKFHENKKTADNPEVAIDTSGIDIDVMPVSDSTMFQSSDMKFIDPIERSDMSPNYFNNDSLSSKVEDRIMNVAKDYYDTHHKCFALVNGESLEMPIYKWRTFCESYHPEVNQNGIWDAPCQVDNDCPFYQANKNYTNDFGKCDKTSGKCEMPQGIIPIGFTKYAKQEPDCYNCGIDSISNKCCGFQADAIKAGIVSYKSPDFIFKNDFTTRRQNDDTIKSLGLHVNPSI
jgi:hypothetical protein